MTQSVVARDRLEVAVVDRIEINVTDGINKPVWSGDAVLFGVEGFSDEGERQLFFRSADALRGAAVLDIGFGGGRTTTLLRLLTDRYIGIDYTPEMVEVARRRHPGTDLRDGDARDLSAFADAAFDTVVFSFNGIDALDHSDRRSCLTEIGRVLRPGGSLLFSTFNIDGPDHDVVPWAVPMLPWQIGSLAPTGSTSPTKRWIKRGLSIAGNLPEQVRGLSNWRRLSRQAVSGPGWQLGTMPAHAFALLVHFISLDAALAELDEFGFDVSFVLAAEDGRELASGESISDVRYFQIRAVRRA